MDLSKSTDFLLRAGVAFSFLYPPLHALANPDSWIGYFPRFLTGYVPDAVLLHTFGVLEVGIALWILFGKKIFLPSLAAAALLLGIVVLNTPQFEVLFRDLSIAAMALVLALMYAPSRERIAH